MTGGQDEGREAVIRLSLMVGLSPEGAVAFDRRIRQQGQWTRNAGPC
jgi:hypothetical protein